MSDGVCVQTRRPFVRLQVLLEFDFLAVNMLLVSSQPIRVSDHPDRPIAAELHFSIKHVCSRVSVCLCVNENAALCWTGHVQQKLKYKRRLLEVFMSKQS